MENIPVNCCDKQDIECVYSSFERGLFYICCHCKARIHVFHRHVTILKPSEEDIPYMVD